jgi:DNA alkylation repair enzyme
MKPVTNPPGAGFSTFILVTTRCVNNWDLVDVSAPSIVGEHLVLRPRRVLYRLAKSSELWERRIAMVATSAFIDRGDLKDAFAIAARLLADRHDLIHKATGWMLREAGKQSRPQLMRFLKHYYLQIPRTTLRYAVEHLPEIQRIESPQGNVRLSCRGSTGTNFAQIIFSMAGITRLNHGTKATSNRPMITTIK